MTKSSKSKILALALCAGVMSGIYASPAMAKVVGVTDYGTATIRPSDFNNGRWPDSVTITGIASQDAIDAVDKKVDGMKDTVDEINEAYKNGDLKGEKGEDGKDGQDGKDGVDGKDGQDGKDGASIASGNYTVNSETGKVEIPVSYLIALARYYNVSTDYLLGLSDERRPFTQK